jgi:hypothetical protein
MSTLDLTDLNFILESLNYTRLKFESYPIGPTGYPSYEFKRKRLDDVESVIAKMREEIKRLSGK